jgi:hypothetical protein
MHIFNSIRSRRKIEARFGPTTVANRVTNGRKGPGDLMMEKVMIEEILGGS